MKIIAVCAGPVAPLTYRTPSGELKTMASALHKVAISVLDEPAPVDISKLGMHTDEHCELTAPAGLDRAVLMLPAEHYRFWAERRAKHNIRKPIQFGSLGENLVVSRLDEGSVFLGDEIRIGSVAFKVTEPRQPSPQFSIHMGYPNASREMIQAEKCGWFMRVIKPGIIKAGDGVQHLRGTGRTSVKARFQELTQTPQLTLI